MLERVIEIITRYNMFGRGARVGAAVSGGADSVCLLHLLEELAPQWSMTIHVLHVDHGLRGPESREDALFVRELAASLGFAVSVFEPVLPPDGNLEQAAREARIAVFKRAITEASLDCVATGHTRSDQAETVLFRFLRGAGSAGLAGIRPVTGDGIVRPLLNVERAETEQYLRSRKLEWREDSTNATSIFARNRIRRELLPQLEHDWNPKIGECLSQTAEWARAEEEYWNAELDRIAGAHLIRRNGFVFSNCNLLAALPLATARRLVRRAMEYTKGDLRSINFGHVEAIIALSGSTLGHGRVQAPGLDIFRSFEWLRFGKQGAAYAEPRDYCAPAAVPGIARVSAAGVEIALELIEKTENLAGLRSVYNEGVGCLDRDRLSGGLTLRNWRPGDQYKPIGSPREEKIKTLFQQARIPIWERRHWPVLADASGIVWSRRFGAAAGCAASSTTRTVLQIRESQLQELASI